MHKDMRSTQINRVPIFKDNFVPHHDTTTIPRFPMPGDDSAYIVCVADKPRIHYCGDNSLCDPQTLSCLNYKVVLNILFKPNFV